MSIQRCWGNTKVPTATDPPWVDRLDHIPLFQNKPPLVKTQGERSTKLGGKHKVPVNWLLDKFSREDSKTHLPWAPPRHHCHHQGHKLSNDHVLARCWAILHIFQMAGQWVIWLQILLYLPTTPHAVSAKMPLRQSFFQKHSKKPQLCGDFLYSSIRCIFLPLITLHILICVACDLHTLS